MKERKAQLKELIKTKSAPSLLKKQTKPKQPPVKIPEPKVKEHVSKSKEPVAKSKDIPEPPKVIKKKTAVEERKFKSPIKVALKPIKPISLTPVKQK